ncbi:MAG: phosphate ABC transporter permease PstA [Candidatus Dormibacteraeota bacterium]|nr:phosphate ABC transporter permease PstA [Candidatus Dormibacteraeota bacterium]
MNRRRLAINAIARAVVYGTALLALIPLGLVLYYTIARGLPAVEHLTFFTCCNLAHPPGLPGGGVANGIAGTVIMVVLASILAIPVGVVAGVHLAEYGHGRLAGWIRLASDVLVGTPSIAIGLFGYALFVAPFHHYSAIAASLALAVLMLPVVMRTTEAAVALIPGGLREAGLALGLPRWRVSLQLVLPAAAPGVITGALLAIARASGETAPLLFTTLGNNFFTLDPTHQMSSLPLIVFHDALTPYNDLNETAWGAALVLVVLVLLINLGSRFVLRRQVALAGKL